MALWLETDTSTNADISSPTPVGVYTATRDAFVLPQVLADQVAGNGDYVYYVTLQVNGAGTHYVMGPKTTQAAASGETGIAAQGGLIFMRNGDVLTVYIDGLAGDTATPDVLVRFAAIPLPAAAAGASGGLPVLDANLVSAVNVTTWEGGALPTIPTASDNATAAAAAILVTPANKLATSIAGIADADVKRWYGDDGFPPTLTSMVDGLFGGGGKWKASALQDMPTALGMADANLDTQLAALPTDADVQAAAAAALTAYDPPTKAEMDEAFRVSFVFDPDTAGATYEDLIEGMPDSGLTAQETADAVNNLAPTGASGATGSIREVIAAIEPGGGSYAGDGTGYYTDTIDDGTNPLDGVRVQLYTAPNRVGPAYEAYTNALGVFQMWPDPGTYYRWLDFSGFSFIQDVAVVVTEP